MSLNRAVKCKQQLACYLTSYLKINHFKCSWKWENMGNQYFSGRHSTLILAYEFQSQFPEEKPCHQLSLLPSILKETLKNTNPKKPQTTPTPKPWLKQHEEQRKILYNFPEQKWFFFRTVLQHFPTTQARAASPDHILWSCDVHRYFV